MNLHDRKKRTSAEVEIVGPPGETEERIAGSVFIGQQKASGWIRLFGALVILAGILLFLVTQDADSGSYEFAIPSGFTFKGGFSALLVVVGAFLIWQSTPKYKIRISPGTSSK